MGKGSDWKRSQIDFALPALAAVKIDDLQPNSNNTRTRIAVTDAFCFDFLLPLYCLVHHGYLIYQASN